ncbi:uncharacterized protein LOC132591526 [Zootoca vivipara]|uniref:uncharacterized protein LOC132591526 n=1 Tax=Zootoca vivipara TaxID=8524 RepID=UPI00293BBF76|nr:uncharacterized protein LOC132591526 [Zootoca vivipara]
MTHVRKPREAKGDERMEGAEGSPGSEVEVMKLRIEMARIESEREKARIEAESEREKARIEAEREKMASEERMQSERIRAQLEQDRMRLEEIRLRSELTQSPVNNDSIAINLKRFPKFGKDDNVESFLFTFERVCVEFQIPEENWMLYLRPQICGILSEIYADLREEELSSYQVFKQRVRVRCGLTAEQSRKAFREAKKEHKETYAQLASRLDKLLDRWIQGSGVKDFDELKQLICLEQFFKQIPSNLRWFLRDKKLKTVAQVAEVLDELQGDFNEIAFPKHSQKGNPWRNREIKDRQENFPVRESVSDKTGSKKITCFFCNREGHVRARCPLLVKSQTTPTAAKQVKLVMQSQENSSPQTEGSEKADRPAETTSKVLQVWRAEQECNQDYMEPIELNGQSFLGLRDTGAEVSLVKSQFVPKEQYLKGQSYSLKGIWGPHFEVPLAEVDITYKGFCGKWRVGILNELEVPFLIGNDLASQKHRIQVITRSQSQVTESNPPAVIESPIEPGEDEGLISVPVVQEHGAQFLSDQKEDETIKELWGKAQSPNAEVTVENPCLFTTIEGRLYRISRRRKTAAVWERKKQLVLPRAYRLQVLQMAHDAPSAAHLGIRKTSDRIQARFYWPGMGKDIQEYCKSCVICQKAGKRADKTRGLLQSIPVITEPFSRVGVDILGPISRVTKRGNKFILCLVDYATRYPEAIPLKDIDSKTVAKALMSVFLRLGFPKEIITDLGTSFTSKTMEELLTLCGIKHVKTTAYHPQSNGLTEKFNSTLSRMLKTYSINHPNDWDERLQHFLFGYREVPQESTGFSPFELLFGRQPQGPLDLMKAAWSGEEQIDSPDVVTYLQELQSDLQELREQAAHNLQQAQRRQKQWYDAHARDRTFQPGDSVLVLRTRRRKKLEMSWDGPFKVVEKISAVNYLVELDGEGNRCKNFHVNLLKPYFDRNKLVLQVKGKVTQGIHLTGWGELSKGTTLAEVSFDESLTPEQKEQLKLVLAQFAQIFSNIPGRTSLATYKIDTG